MTPPGQYWQNKRRIRRTPFIEEQVVPGPGHESGFQSYCGAEYERVYALALETIRTNMAIDGDSAEALSRKIAAAHADKLYWQLTGQGAGASKRLNLIEQPKARERTPLRSVEAAYR